MKKLFLFLFSVFAWASCSNSGDNATAQQDLYFPPVGSDVWETTSINELGWNSAAVAPLMAYLEEKHSKSFIILVDGKIVMENYFNGQTVSSNWYWASAGKTLTSTMAGIAEQEGLLNINDKVSDYLGTGWTSAPLEKENLITNRHLLTMTSGLDDDLGDDVSPANLQYIADGGTRWAYHNVYREIAGCNCRSDRTNFFGLL